LASAIQGRAQREPPSDPSGGAAVAEAPANGAALRGTGTLLLSVIVPDGPGQDDEWQVEVPREATVAQLKERVEELYEVPVFVQQLQLTRGVGDPTLPDDTRVESFAAQPVYLLAQNEAVSMHDGPLPGHEAIDELQEALQVAMQERADTARALQESLAGVTYQITFLRPTEAGGAAAGKQVRLTLDALSLAGDAQCMAELELFGAVGLEPCFLTFGAVFLEAEMPIHMAGVGDGDTLTLGKEMPHEDDDLEEQALLASQIASIEELN